METFKENNFYVSSEMEVNVQMAPDWATEDTIDNVTEALVAYNPQWRGQPLSVEGANDGTVSVFVGEGAEKMRVMSLTKDMVPDLLFSADTTAGDKARARALRYKEARERRNFISQHPLDYNRKVFAGYMGEVGKSIVDFGSLFFRKPTEEMRRGFTNTMKGSE